MKLSKRLELLAYLVEKHKKGNILADIGTDHAYLPCYLIEKNIIDKAYACDVAKGPFAASLSTIKQYHFEENVEALLGDGLDPILDKEVDMVTIAGMGSFLIVEILEKNKINPKIFFAPAHTFDENTLKALKNVSDIRIISDTIADDIYFKDDIYYIPQQSGACRALPFKVVTFCYHPNIMEENDFKKLEEFLKKHNKEFGIADESILKYRKFSIKDFGLKKLYFIRRK